MLVTMQNWTMLQRVLDVHFNQRSLEVFRSLNLHIIGRHREITENFVNHINDAAFMNDEASMMDSMDMLRYKISHWERLVNMQKERNEIRRLAIEAIEEYNARISYIETMEELNAKWCHWKNLLELKAKFRAESSEHCDSFPAWKREFQNTMHDGTIFSTDFYNIVIHYAGLLLLTLISGILIFSLIYLTNHLSKIILYVTKFLFKSLVCYINKIWYKENQKQQTYLNLNLVECTLYLFLYEYNCYQTISLFKLHKYAILGFCNIAYTKTYLLFIY